MIEGWDQPPADFGIADVTISDRRVARRPRVAAR